MSTFVSCPRVRPGTQVARRVVVHVKEWGTETGGAVALKEKQLPTERFIATNRFKVKPGQGAAFEKRWTIRKSRLATLEGFRFFCLLRRVGRTSSDPAPPDEPNYVSFTVWEDKSNFDAWYSGDAFKEAHGGGSIWGFADMLINSLFTLDGPPKPAFWHGLLPLSIPGDMSGKRVEAGWRVVEADGKNTLPAEVFVVCNRFRIEDGAEEAFEARWAERESFLQATDGFKAFFMCRRDAANADDGYNYQSTTVWRDRAAFENWTKSQAFSKSHGPSDKPKAGFEGMAGPPSPAFFEGVLALETPAGA